MARLRAEVAELRQCLGQRPETVDEKVEVSISKAAIRDAKEVAQTLYNLRTDYIASMNRLVDLVHAQEWNLKKDAIRDALMTGKCLTGKFKFPTAVLCHLDELNAQEEIRNDALHFALKGRRARSPIGPKMGACPKSP